MSGIYSGIFQIPTGVYPYGTTGVASPIGSPITVSYITASGPLVPIDPQQSLFSDPDLAVPVVKKKKDFDGCSCKKCGEFYMYAEPNQSDGTLICYSCRIRW